MIDLPVLYKIDIWMLSAILFLVMLLSVFLGRKIGSRYIKGDAESNTILTAGIFTLVAFILAFSFSIAGSRFDTIKKVIVEESNDIGTAILRSGMYPDSIKILLRQDFSEYLEARIKYAEAGSDLNKIKAAIIKSEESGLKLFNRAAELSRDSKYHSATMLFIPALNSMLDIATTRLNDELYKVPAPIIYMLFLLLTISSFVYGYNNSKKSTGLDWYMIICYCLITSLVIYFMLDLDRPRRGLINLNESYMAIENLRSLLE